MPTFHYVYILTSETHPSVIYIGQTKNLQRRLTQHNSGNSCYTSRHRPWRIRAAVALTSRKRALELERCLKSQSGRAFISKRL